MAISALCIAHGCGRLIERRAGIGLSRGRRVGLAGGTRWDLRPEVVDSGRASLSTLGARRNKWNGRHDGKIAEEDSVEQTEAAGQRDSERRPVGRLPSDMM